MSIILRKEGQELLDGLGLQNYHFAIADNNDMRIVGECGKPLCTVKGVMFTRKTPAMREIDYALELADAYLAKHLPLLRELIHLQKYEDTMDMSGITTQYHSGKLDTIRYELEDYTLHLNAEGSLSKVSIVSKTATSVKIPASIVKQHKTTVKAFNARFEHYASIRKVEELLNSCSI